MAIFDEDDSLLDFELGQTLQIPCKFVEGVSQTHPVLIKNLTAQMKKTGKNILPVIVKLLEEDSYEAIQNTQILEAARRANLDFIWCIVVDEQMLEQVLVESGELIRVPLLQASEKDIVEVLEYVKAAKIGPSIIQSEKAAKAIIAQREQGQLKNLKFITKKKCGIGKVTLAKIAKFFPVE